MAIKLSAEPETIEACYEVWRKLVEELEKLVGENFVREEERSGALLRKVSG